MLSELGVGVVQFAIPDAQRGCPGEEVPLSVHFSFSSPRAAWGEASKWRLIGDLFLFFKTTPTFNENSGFSNIMLESSNSALNNLL